MAEDAIVLLDYIGWTGKRDVHVIGTSLGGMIAMGTFYNLNGTSRIVQPDCLLKSWLAGFLNGYVL